MSRTKKATEPDPTAPEQPAEPETAATATAQAGSEDDPDEEKDVPDEDDEEEPDAAAKAPPEETHRQAMRGLTEDVEEKTEVVDRRARLLKEAKADLEAAQAALQRYVWRYSHPEEEAPLFHQANGQPAKPAEPRADDAWRSVPLSEALVGLTPKMLANLCDGANVRTVGELADWTAAGGVMTELKGIGPTAADKIDEALESFWSRWRAAAPLVEAATPTEALSAVAEGPPLPFSPVVRATLASLDLPAAAIEAAYVAAALAGPAPDKPIAVKPVEIETRLFVCTAAVSGEGGARTWYLRPLYERAEFLENFPDRELTTGPAPGEGLRDAYFGVTVKCGKRDCVIGPIGEEMVVMEEATSEEAES